MIPEIMIQSIAAWIGDKIADKGIDALRDKLTSIDANFKRCVQEVAEELEKIYPDILGKSIGDFFSKEEIFGELIKLLFVNQQVNEEVISQSFDTETLPQDFILEFVTRLKSKLEQETVFQELLANKEILNALTGVAANVGDIKTALLKIHENLSKNEFDPCAFVSRYKQKLINNFDTVPFFGLGIDPSIQKGKRKELDSIFIKPTFQINSKFHLEIEKKANRNLLRFISGDDKVSFRNLFDRDYHYIILGDPGAGKSLLLKAIMLYISKNEKEFENEDILQYVPFYVELKDYIAFKKQGEKGVCLLKYLVHALEKTFSSVITEDNLQEILKNEKTLLLFDGLDEIFNIKDKHDVKNDVENFRVDFPNVKSMTTSRKTGYDEVKFDEKKFCEMCILPFDDEQMKEYVHKWYQIEEEDAITREKEISEFISKTNNLDKELISNPLLLSLIVILYRNNLEIPGSKFEIYQSCTNTLVDKWDAYRQVRIEIESAILEKKESIFADLAFWQYTALSSKNPDITYRKVKAEVAASLVRKNLADDDNKDAKAEKFLEYARKRSIYFDNRFYHKTFLEYFTAYWIYSNYEKKNKPEERNRIIIVYNSNEFWFIVLELLLNFIDKDQPDTEILDGIIEDNCRTPSSLPFLLHVLPVLKNISEKAQILVYTKTIEHILVLKANEPTWADNGDEVKLRLFQKIMENANNPKQKEIICKAVNYSPYKNLSFYIFIGELVIHSSFSSNFNFDEIRNTSEYQELMEKDPYLFYLANYYDTANYFENTLKYIDFFGVDAMFEDNKSWFIGFRCMGYFSLFLSFQLLPQHITSLLSNLETLEKHSLSKIRFLKVLINIPYLEFKRSSINSIQYLLCAIADINEIEKVVCLILLSFLLSLLTSLLGPVFPFHYNTSPQIENLLLRSEDMFRKQFLKEVIKEFDISDKEILALLD